MTFCGQIILLKSETWNRIQWVDNLIAAAQATYKSSIYHTALCCSARGQDNTKFCGVITKQWDPAYNIYTVQVYLKVYMTDFFFICSIKCPQRTDKYSIQNYATAIFLPSVLTYWNCKIPLLVGYKTTRAKTGDWEWLSHHFQGSTLKLTRSPLESKIRSVESAKCQWTKITCPIRKVIFYSMESSFWCSNRLVEN